MHSHRALIPLQLQRHGGMDWDVVMEGYMVFRRDRLGRSGVGGGGVALCVRKNEMYRALSW